ncbi:MAG TPA: RNA 2'-phosphotransferase, partial [Chloroflexi bacterium]|nr:RNA 2'-phosphotransferase [Chloroflexota bacterium]
HGKRRIRALYGHSIVCPTYEPVTPPQALYHGTTPDVVDAIRSDGLRPMGLQYVHLAATVELARHIGLRRTSSPIILRVNALEAHAHGVRFYNPETDIFLSEFIPPEFIEFPEQR